MAKIGFENYFKSQLWIERTEAEVALLSTLYDIAAEAYDFGGGDLFRYLYNLTSLYQDDNEK